MGIRVSRFPRSYTLPTLWMVSFLKCGCFSRGASACGAGGRVALGRSTPWTWVPCHSSRNTCYLRAPDTAGAEHPVSLWAPWSREWLRWRTALLLWAGGSGLERCQAFLWRSLSLFNGQDYLFHNISVHDICLDLCESFQDRFQQRWSVSQTVFLTVTVCRWLFLHVCHCWLFFNDFNLVI